jgi:hypothetical protein
MTRQKPLPRFAICIKTDDADLITPRMIYEILPDDSAAKSHYLRVVDNEGEDYLYPADHFVMVDFPQVVQQALLHVSRPSLERAPARRRQRAPSTRPRKAKEKAA